MQADKGSGRLAANQQSSCNPDGGLRCLLPHTPHPGSCTVMGANPAAGKRGERACGGLGRRGRHEEI